MTSSAVTEDVPGSDPAESDPEGQMTRTTIEAVGRWRREHAQWLADGGGIGAGARGQSPGCGVRTRSQKSLLHAEDTPAPRGPGRASAEGQGNGVPGKRPTSTLTVAPTKLDPEQISFDLNCRVFKNKMGCQIWNPNNGDVSNYNPWTQCSPRLAHSWGGEEWKETEPDDPEWEEESLDGSQSEEEEEEEEIDILLDLPTLTTYLSWASFSLEQLEHQQVFDAGAMKGQTVKTCQDLLRLWTANVVERGYHQLPTIHVGAVEWQNVVPLDDWLEAEAELRAFWWRDRSVPGTNRPWGNKAFRKQWRVSFPRSAIDCNVLLLPAQTPIPVRMWAEKGWQVLQIPRQWVPGEPEAEEAELAVVKLLSQGKQRELAAGLLYISVADAFISQPKSLSRQGLLNQIHELTREVEKRGAHELNLRTKLREARRGHNYESGKSGHGERKGTAGPSTWTAPSPASNLTKTWDPLPARDWRTDWQQAIWELEWAKTNPKAAAGEEAGLPATPIYPTVGHARELGIPVSALRADYEAAENEHRRITGGSVTQVILMMNAGPAAAAMGPGAAGGGAPWRFNDVKAMKELLGLLSPSPSVVITFTQQLAHLEDVGERPDTLRMVASNIVMAGKHPPFCNVVKALDQEVRIARAGVTVEQQCSYWLLHLRNRLKEIVKDPVAIQKAEAELVTLAWKNQTVEEVAARLHELADQVSPDNPVRQCELRSQAWVRMVAAKPRLGDLLMDTMQDITSGYQDDPPDFRAMRIVNRLEEVIRRRVQQMERAEPHQSSRVHLLHDGGTELAALVERVSRLESRGQGTKRPESPGPTRRASRSPSPRFRSMMEDCALCPSPQFPHPISWCPDLQHHASQPTSNGRPPFYKGVWQRPCPSFGEQFLLYLNGTRSHVWEGLPGETARGLGAGPAGGTAPVRLVSQESGDSPGDEPDRRSSTLLDDSFEDFSAWRAPRSGYAGGGMGIYMIQADTETLCPVSNDDHAETDPWVTGPMGDMDYGEGETGREDPVGRTLANAAHTFLNQPQAGPGGRLQHLAEQRRKLAEERWTLAQVVCRAYVFLAQTPGEKREGHFDAFWRAAAYLTDNPLMDSSNTDRCSVKKLRHYIEHMGADLIAQDPAVRVDNLLNAFTALQESVARYRPLLESYEESLATHLQGHREREEETEWSSDPLAPGWEKCRRDLRKTAGDVAAALGRFLGCDFPQWTCEAGVILHPETMKESLRIFFQAIDSCAADRRIVPRYVHDAVALLAGMRRVEDGHEQKNEEAVAPVGLYQELERIVGPGGAPPSLLLDTAAARVSELVQENGALRAELRHLRSVMGNLKTLSGRPDAAAMSYLGKISSPFTALGGDLADFLKQSDDAVRGLGYTVYPPAAPIDLNKFNIVKQFRAAAEGLPADLTLYDARPTSGTSDNATGPTIHAAAVVVSKLYRDKLAERAAGVRGGRSLGVTERLWFHRAGPGLLSGAERRTHKDEKDKVGGKMKNDSGGHRREPVVPQQAVRSQAQGGRGPGEHEWVRVGESPSAPVQGQCPGLGRGRFPRGPRRPDPASKPPWDGAAVRGATVEGEEVNEWSVEALLHPLATSTPLPSPRASPRAVRLSGFRGPFGRQGSTPFAPRQLPPAICPPANCPPADCPLRQLPPANCPLRQLPPATIAPRPIAPCDNCPPVNNHLRAFNCPPPPVICPPRQCPPPPPLTIHLHAMSFLAEFNSPNIKTLCLFVLIVHYL